MGRPTKDFNNTPEALANIEEWCSSGYTLRSIAKQFGVGEDTFRKWRQQHPEINEAIERGMVADEQLCMHELRSLAFDSSFKNRLTALLAYGKIKHRWNDGSRNDVKPTEPTEAPKQLPVNLDD